MISVIVCTFNAKELLDKCLENLTPMTLDMEVIVVDNGSSDGSAEMVKAKYGSKVKLIETDNNGLATAYNLGFQKSKGDYILYLGSDAYPSEDAIKSVVQYLETNPNVGIATARLVLRDGTPDMDSHRAFPSPFVALAHFSGLGKLFPNSSFFNKYFLAGRDLNTIHDIDACISHFMMIKRTVQESVGVWDQDYFLFGEDIDMCYRVKQKGFRVVYIGTVPVLHFKGGIIGRKTSKDLNVAAHKTLTVRKRIPLESVKSMRIFYSKHYKNVYPRALTSLVLLGIKCMEILRFIKSRFN